MSKIAVIDDARADLMLIETILATAGHQAITFQSVDGVEERLAELAPDLVLLDVVLPQRSGYDVLRRLKRDLRTRAIPVVLVSSKGETSDVEWGRRQGADGYVTKPFTPEVLLGEVTRLIP